MDYKNEIIKLLENINDSKVLRYIYIVISDLLK